MCLSLIRYVAGNWFSDYHNPFNLIQFVSVFMTLLRKLCEEHNFFLGLLQAGCNKPDKDLKGGMSNEILE